MRKTVRGAALVAAAGALALGMSACGDDDEESGGTVDPPVLSLSVTESGKESTLKAPAEAKSGVTKIALKNGGKKTHEGQIVRVEDDHTAEEVIAAVGEDSKGIPDWIVDGGGVGIVEPGRTGEVIQDLEARPLRRVRLRGRRGRPGPGHRRVHRHRREGHRRRHARDGRHDHGEGVRLRDRGA